MEFDEGFKKRFVRRLQGKDFILYGGLLELARQRGLKRLEVDIIQIPSASNGNHGVCSARLEAEDGSTYREVGDASPDNVNGNIVPHILRMAATRAKARALRDFTGVDMVSFEEVGELQDEAPQDKEDIGPSPGGTKANEVGLPPCSGCGAQITQAVHNFSMSRFGMPLCMACQRKAAAG